jgi:CRISPR type III-A-associated RAMP protein Csm5
MKIKLETLSPIHIGSGTQYQGNAEYLYFEKEKVVVVADESKILEIIGTENIHIWVGYIEDRENKKNFLEYLRQRKPDIRPEDVARRIIPLKGSRAPYFTNTLREQMHGGMGQPYLPGSSIKGAIRTAIFSQTIISKYTGRGLGDRELNFRLVRTKVGTEVPDFNDKNLQQEVFGRDPNSDWLRMLQVGDCYFPSGTYAAFAETLNEKGANQHYEIKGEVRQLIEYIPAEKSAEFQINIPATHRDLILRKDPQLFKNAVRQLNAAWLCKLIHEHSLRLLKSEIAFFEDADLPGEAEGLPDFMQELLTQAKAFPENTCLLRLGFGTGYRNMTGDWVKDLVHDDGLYDDIATATRRTPRYNGMPLPKSRKMMFDGVLPGYVKLTFLLP